MKPMHDIISVLNSQEHQQLKLSLENCADKAQQNLEENTNCPMRF